MTDSLLNKYTRPQTEPDDPQFETEDLGSFGWLRGMRERARMLELRKKDGNITVIGFAWIETVDFAPSEVITFRAPTYKSKSKGSTSTSKSGQNPLLRWSDPPSSLTEWESFRTRQS